MNRRDMVLETCLALCAVTAIVVGNFLVQRWWSSSQTVRVVDAAAEGDPLASVPQPTKTSDLDDDLVPPSVANERASAKDADRRQMRLRKLIAEQLPDASPEEHDSWMSQLEDVPFETAVGILETRKEVGALGDWSETSP